jgi:hypothetical protein
MSGKRADTLFTSAAEAVIALRDGWQRLRAAIERQSRSRAPTANAARG